MLIKEQWGIEKCPILGLFRAYEKNAFLVKIVNFCERDFWEHALNYSQYIVSGKNKHFKFELDRKLNPWLKFEPNFLTWLPNGK